MKEILYIAPANSIHAYKWYITALNKLYHKTIWISFHKPNLLSRNIKNLNYVPKILILFFWIKIFFKNKFKIIHIHSCGFYSLPSILASLIFPFSKIIVSPWGSDLIFGKKNFLRKILLNLIFRRANIITCDADFMISEVKKIYPKSNCVRINFGIDTEFFSPIRKEKKLKCPAENITIISTRNLEPIYNIDCLITAFSKLEYMKNKINLIILGDGSERKRLENLVNQLGLEKKITFQGKYSQSELLTHLRKSDIYISTSTSDAGIAASTAEAMAVGCLCIISDVAENNFWIKDGTNGYLFKCSNPNDLALKIKKSIKNRENWDKFGKKSRNKILENNSLKNEMRKVSKIYSQFLC